MPQKRHILLVLLILAISLLACNAVKTSANVYAIKPGDNMAGVSKNTRGKGIQITDASFVNGAYPDSKDFFGSSAHVTSNTVGYAATLQSEGDAVVSVEYTWSVVHVPSAPDADGEIIAQNSYTKKLTGDDVVMYSNVTLDNFDQFPSGTYRIEVAINGSTLDQRDFEVY